MAVVCVHCMHMLVGCAHELCRSVIIKDLHDDADDDDDDIVMTMIFMMIMLLLCL